MPDSGVVENGFQRGILDVGANLFGEEISNGRENLDAGDGACLFATTGGEDCIARAKADDGDVFWIGVNESWKGP